MGVFVTRLVDWQIINYEYYKKRAISSKVYFINTDPVRGEILDCEGNGLAINDTGYKVVLDRLLVDKSQENDLIVKIIKLIEYLGNEWIDVLPIRLQNDKFEFCDNSESEISILRKMLNIGEDVSAEDCINIMCEKYKAKDYNSEEKRIICSVKYNMEKKGIYFLNSTPCVLADNLNKKSVIVLSEKHDELKGIRVQTSTVRKNVNGSLLAHILGYTGFMSAEEYENHKNDYPLDSIIGKSGVERTFENILHGVGGKRMVQMSDDGDIVNVSEKKEAIPGKTIFLTISSKLQEVANKSLEENVTKMKKSGVKDCTSGAAVVLNVNDFSILAAASYPNYDLERFSSDKSYYSELYSDPTKPLLNRAFSGAYAPGSIYKPLVGCAALQSGLVTPDEKIVCNGGYHYYRGYTLRCMGHHGAINMVNALAKSCNVYFAELGRRLGATELEKWANKFGMGVETGVEIGESKGIIAGPNHSKKVGAKWYESGSSQAAIGQSDNMITPLQLATYTATIANGGKRCKTHLVKKVTDYARNNILEEKGAEVVEKIDISEENIKTIKEGMRKVILSGTARDFANYPIEVAGKTGTAQNAGTDHTTFICFAPYEKPEIAIAVVIEHGKSGMASKNVARDIMNTYFDIKK